MLTMWDFESITTLNPCASPVGRHVVNLFQTYVQPRVGCLYQLALTWRQVDSVALGIPCWCVIRYFVAILVMLRLFSPEAKTKPQWTVWACAKVSINQYLCQSGKLMAGSRYINLLENTETLQLLFQLTWSRPLYSTLTVVYPQI